MVKKCDYGCGKEGKHQFKNGKWCCSDSWNKCESLRDKNSKGHLGEVFSEERKRKISESNKGRTISKETREKLSKSQKGRKAWNKGISQSKKVRKKISKGNKGKIVSRETRRKISSGLIGRPKSKEHRKRLSESRMGRFTGKENPFFGKKHTRETLNRIINHPNRIKFYKKQSKKMKNGHAAYMNSFIKNPSKPQIELYKMVLELCPYAILNYPCLNYSIDIAIPFLEVAIEYDEPYWHQDKEYDTKRQRILEKEGWKFIRFSSIPNKKEIQREIYRRRTE